MLVRLTDCLRTVVTWTDPTTYLVPETWAYSLHHRVQFLWVWFKFEALICLILWQKPFSKEQTQLSAVWGDALSCYSKDTVSLVFGWFSKNGVRIYITYPCVYMVSETEMSRAAFTAHHKQALTPCNGTVFMYSAWVFRTTTVLTLRVSLRIQLSTETKPSFFAKQN